MKRKKIMTKSTHIINISVVALLTFFLIACTKTKGDGSGDVLVSIGHSNLTKEDLQKELPAGLPPEDSTKISRAFIRSWIDSHLISEIAARNIGDLTEIDRMTEQYRNDLIAYEYRKRMYDDHLKNSLSKDSIEAYYNSHKAELILQRPIIKGIYLKIPNDSPALKKAKKLYCSDKTEDIDKLEKECLNGAIHYDYFKDRWVDWERIEALIPEDFGSNPNAFLTSHDKVEISQGGFTYLLYISEYVTSGNIMPYQYAEETIKDILAYQQRAQYDRKLRIDLLKEAEDNGEITINCALE